MQLLNQILDRHKRMPRWTSPSQGPDIANNLYVLAWNSYEMIEHPSIFNDWEENGWTCESLELLTAERRRRRWDLFCFGRWPSRSPPPRPPPVNRMLKTQKIDQQYLWGRTVHDSTLFFDIDYSLTIWQWYRCSRIPMRLSVRLSRALCEASFDIEPWWE